MVHRILSAGLLLLMLAALELNKNTIAGWILAVACAVGFTVLRETALSGKAWWLRGCGWLGWIALFAVIVVITYPPVRSVPAVDAKDPRETGIIRVAQGELTGVYTEDGEVEVYCGIPYAKPPVGELRWREPQDPDPWEGVLKADKFAPMSMQPVELPIVGSLKAIFGFHDYKISLSDNCRPPVSEDSLYLNVWKPAGDVSGLPVLVYVHGGSLQTGQPWYADYSGVGLAHDGVIVVNMGYRLGVFGFFADGELAAESPNGTTGNYGLLDQIKALEWVRDNISAFGGDPANVTLAGESAGAASVSALCASPLAKGLFRRAVLESSTVVTAKPPHSFRTLEEAAASGKTVRERFGCETLAELRALPADKLAAAADTEHHITVDGYVLTELPLDAYLNGNNNEEAVLHGYNAEESAAFIIFSLAKLKDYEELVRGYFKEYADDVLAVYPASTDAEADEYWAEIYGAVFFDYPHYCLARVAAEKGIPAYEYYFSKQNGRIGCWHSGEEVYLYGNIPADSGLYDDSDRELSRVMKSYYLNFIRTGDPNGGGLPEWKAGAEPERMMGLGDKVEPVRESERKLKLYEIIDRMEGFKPDRQAGLTKN